jgi:uncharacterized Zn-binding protein involved in type VI secretion
MPGMSTQGDICSGHGCYPPRQVIAWSGTVFANSKGCHRQYDGLGPHTDGCDDDHPTHIAIGVKGSSQVYINSRQAMRIGDPVGCASAIATGSNNVYCGGG